MERKYNTHAMAEMEVISKTCNTADALTAGINGIIKKYQASEEIVKTYDNGLVKVAILDKDGLLIGEYTRGPQEYGACYISGAGGRENKAYNDSNKTKTRRDRPTLLRPLPGSGQN